MSDDPVIVTTAGRSHSDDIRLRQRRYLVTQGIRVACVLLAVFLPVPVAWRLGFIAGAVVLPYVGVVAANAGPTVSRRRRTAIVEPSPHPRPLPPGPVIDAEEVA